MDGLHMEQAVFKAVMTEDAPMIRRLLEAGVDTGCTNEGGQTPLELAATRGKLESLFLLLDEDGSGDVSKKELKQLGAAVGVKLTDKDLWSLMTALDEDSSGSVDLEEFSEERSRKFLSGFLAKISPGGFGWVDDELNKIAEMDAILQEQLEVEKEEREAAKRSSQNAATKIAYKAAKRAKARAAEEAAAEAERKAREGLRATLLACVNEGATNMDGMNTVMAMLDDPDSESTAVSLLERWEGRLEAHRNRQALVEARESEREERRREKAEGEAAHARCQLEPEVFEERKEMVMQRAAEQGLNPAVEEEEAVDCLRKAAGHAGGALAELTRRRSREETESSAVEAAIVLQNAPEGDSAPARHFAFAKALASGVEGMDWERIVVTDMAPAGVTAEPAAGGRPPPPTPGWLRLSFRILEPFGAEADGGAPSSEAVLHRLDELSETGMVAALARSGMTMMRYEPDKEAAARAQSREAKTLDLLSKQSEREAKAAAEAKEEAERLAGSAPIPLSCRRVTYAHTIRPASAPASDASAAGAGTAAGSSPVAPASASVWLWYCVPGSEDWPERDPEGVRRVVFKYRRLRFVSSRRLATQGGQGHEGIDSMPDPDMDEEQAATKEAEDRAREKRRRHRAEEQDDPVRAAFDEYDVDNSGALDVQEVTALLHDRGFRMTAAELEGVFEAIDEDNSGDIDLAELRKMWTFLGMHMEARGSSREVPDSSDEETEEKAAEAPPPSTDSSKGWCALSGPAVKCEDGWWRSSSWAVAPGFEHSVWVDGKMSGTFADPQMVVTAAPNELDAEPEADPVLLTTKVGSRTIVTSVAASDEDGKPKPKRGDGPRIWSFPCTEPPGSGGAGEFSVTIERCAGLHRAKEVRGQGIYAVMALGSSGMARRSGMVHGKGKKLSWHGHHGSARFEGLPHAPDKLHVFLLRRPAQRTHPSPPGKDAASVSEVRSALRKIYQNYKPAKLDDVDALLAEWRGHEAELLVNVSAKYEHNPEAEAAAADGAAFDAWGRTEGDVLLGALTLHLDHAPAGRSWRLAQEVELLHPHPRQGDEAVEEEEDPAFTDEGEALLDVARLLLGARGGPGGWGAGQKAGRLTVAVRWVEQPM